MEARSYSFTVKKIFGLGKIEANYSNKDLQKNCPSNLTSHWKGTNHKTSVGEQKAEGHNIILEI